MPFFVLFQLTFTPHEDQPHRTFTSRCPNPTLQCLPNRPCPAAASRAGPPAPRHGQDRPSAACRSAGRWRWNCSLEGEFGQGFGLTAGTHSELLGTAARTALSDLVLTVTNAERILVGKSYRRDHFFRGVP